MSISTEDKLTYTYEIFMSCKENENNKEFPVELLNYYNINKNKFNKVSN